MFKVELVSDKIKDDIDISLKESNGQTVQNEHHGMYISAIKSNLRIFGKNSSHKTTVTGIYDDLIFRNFECHGLLSQYSSHNQINLDEMNLAEKCERITLGANSSTQANNTDQEMSHFIKFGPNDSLLTKLPINMLEDVFDAGDNLIVASLEPRKNRTQNTLLSALSQTQSNKPKKNISIKHRNLKPIAASEQSPRVTIATNKRAHNESEASQEIGTPKSKRRIVLAEDEKSTPIRIPNNNNRTILHYFQLKSVAPFSR
jgi:hypothetical protein